jgi:site-specific DNA-cytosine methylase
MSLVSSVPTTALILEGFSMKWSNSGIASRGELWTLVTSESPNDAVEYSLSQVLNPTAPQRFSLSAKAASGILRRAGRRGKVLPAALQTALESLAQSLQDSPTEQEQPKTNSMLDTGSESLAQSQEDLAKGSTAPSTNRSSSVRRLTPTECERLMGWPDGWTISKSWRGKRHSANTK